MWGITAMSCDSPIFFEIFMVIEHIERVGNTPVLNFLRRIDYELLTQGFAKAPSALIVDELEAVYALGPDDEVIGAIAFRYDEEDRSVWITVSGVREDFRRNGIYRQLYERLITHAKNLDALTIHSGVSVKNTVMLEARKSMGFEPTFLSFTHRLSNF